MKKPITFLLLLLSLGSFSLSQAQWNVDTSVVHVGDDIAYRFHADAVQKSKDGGKSWKTLKVTYKTHEKVTSTRLPFNLHRNMMWIDKDNGYLFGDDGTYAYATVILRTTNGGASWHSSHAEMISQSGALLEKIEIIDDKHHIGMFGITGSFSLKKKSKYMAMRFMISRDGGLTWKQRSLPVDEDKRFNSLAFEHEFNKDGSGFIEVDGAKWITRDFGNKWDQENRK